MQKRKAAAAVGLIVALWGLFLAFLPWESILGSSGQHHRHDSASTGLAGCPWLPSSFSALGKLLPFSLHRFLLKASPQLSSVIGLQADGLSFLSFVGGESRRVDPATGLPILTRVELQAFDGSDPALPLLLGIGGEVFDVKEKGAQHYGKDAPYNIFAGKDSSRALSLGSFADEDVYGGTEGFDEQQQKNLREQLAFYRDKYGPAVALIDPNSPFPTPPPKSKEELEKEAEQEAAAAAAAEQDKERQQREGIRTTFVVATPPPTPTPTPTPTPAA